MDHELDHDRLVLVVPAVRGYHELRHVGTVDGHRRTVCGARPAGWTAARSATEAAAEQLLPCLSCATAIGRTGISFDRAS
jgi:hypothetical protein